MIKKQRFFPCGAFLSHVVGKCLLNCPNFKKTPILQTSWLCACSDKYYFPHKILTPPIEVYPPTNVRKNFVPTKF